MSLANGGDPEQTAHSVKQQFDLGLHCLQFCMGLLKVSLYNNLPLLCLQHIFANIQNLQNIFHLHLGVLVVRKVLCHPSFPVVLARPSFLAVLIILEVHRYLGLPGEKHIQIRVTRTDREDI